MRRRVVIMIGTIFVLLLAWVLPVAVFNLVQNRHTVPAQAILVHNPNAYPFLAELEWKNLRTGPDTEAVYDRAWTSGMVRLTERAQRYGSTLSATYAYGLQDPLLAQHRNPPTLGGNPPPGLRADQVELYCSRFVHKHGPSLGKCFGWVAWMRYGQYTVYLSVSRAVLSRADFYAIMRHADAVVTQRLPE